jgi:hypothetical protein
MMIREVKAGQVFKNSKDQCFLMIRGRNWEPLMLGADCYASIIKSPHEEVELLSQEEAQAWLQNVSVA